jgi:hypothetical protein
MMQLNVLQAVNFLLTLQIHVTQSNSEKPKNERAAIIKCPKCGHEFRCDSGWIEASATIG